MAIYSSLSEMPKKEDEESKSAILSAAKLPAGMPYAMKQPIINEPLVAYPYLDDNIIIHPFGVRPSVDFRSLHAYARGSPEVIAVLTAIIDDILSDGWTLVADGEKSSGRNRIKRAEEFLRKNNAKEAFYSVLFDALITGNGYLYKKPFMTREYVKSQVEALVDKMPWQGKGKIWREQLKTQAYLGVMEEYKAYDEDLFSVRDFRPVASSTMQANFDQFGNVKQWIQRVGAAYSVFSNEEIMHLRFMFVNGEFYGFTPLISMINELDILNNVKDYARYFFEKGGVPPFIFTFENETPNSPTYKEMRRSLQLYGQLTNKWKSLVLTGKVNVQPVQPNNKDMEFRQLAIYLTQIIIMLWGVPPARLPNLIISGGSRSDVTTMDGYYRKISHHQDIFEDWVNNFLLKDFGVKMKFNKTYMNEEVRDNQSMMLRSDLALKLFNAGAVDDVWVWEYLQIPDERRAKLEKQDILNNRQGALPSGAVEKSPNKQLDDKVKQDKNTENKKSYKKKYTLVQKGNITEVEGDYE